jgi:hypothetical protein
MKILTPQASLDVLTATLDQLTVKFLHLSIFDSTQMREVIINRDSHSDMSVLEISSEVQDEGLVHFPLRLKNLASIYQDMISYIVTEPSKL